MGRLCAVWMFGFSRPAAGLTATGRTLARHLAHGKS
jgi:hypothetical protein